MNIKKYIIDKSACVSCGLCADVCPVEAIAGIGGYKINPNLCTGCGECSRDCPVRAIKIDQNYG
jgi:MinD superfamily P-loop ATPase